MRLSNSEIANITHIIGAAVHGSHAELYLFGSRANDKKRGGDIDLLLLVQDSLLNKITLSKLDIVTRISESLGERKIDLTVSGEKNRSDFVRQVLPNAILLHRFGAEIDPPKTVRWIRKTQSSRDFALLDDYSEVTWSRFCKWVAAGQFPGLSVFGKKGKRAVRAKRNDAISDNLGAKIIACREDDVLIYDGKNIFVRARNGRIKRQWLASSGSPNARPEDQNKANFGPIPEGRYTVDFRGTLDFDMEKKLWERTKWVLKSPRWGWIVTPLIPSKDTRTFGRKGFFIHGGLFPGSNGCIDLTEKNEDFHTYMRMYRRNFTLTVRYVTQ